MSQSKTRRRAVGICICSLVLLAGALHSAAQEFADRMVLQAAAKHLTSHVAVPEPTLYRDGHPQPPSPTLPV